MTAPEPTDTPLDEAVGSAETPDGSAATPEGLRMDVVAEGEVTALLPTGVGDLALLIDGWFESHSPEGGRGAHLAIRQARQPGAAPIVVHVSQVPALVAALTEVSLRLTQLWERDGQEHWPGQLAPGGAGPQDSGSVGVVAQPVLESEEDRDERGRARHRHKVEVLECVHARAPDVLASFTRRCTKWAQFRHTATSGCAPRRTTASAGLCCSQHQHCTAGWGDRSATARPPAEQLERDWDQ